MSFDILAVIFSDFLPLVLKPQLNVLPCEVLLSFLMVPNPPCYTDLLTCCVHTRNLHARKSLALAPLQHRITNEEGALLGSVVRPGPWPLLPFFCIFRCFVMPRFSEFGFLNCGSYSAEQPERSYTSGPIPLSAPQTIRRWCCAK